jgi:hypothetical protein
MQYTKLTLEQQQQTSTTTEIPKSLATAFLLCATKDTTDTKMCYDCVLIRGNEVIAPGYALSGSIRPDRNFAVIENPW